MWQLSYYKLELQNGVGITNQGKICPKLGQYLQIRAIIANWCITTSTEDILVLHNGVNGDTQDIGNELNNSNSKFYIGECVELNKF